MHVSVKDIASFPSSAVTDEATIAEALELLLTFGVSELYVTDRNGLLLGVVTDYDLLKTQMNGTVETQPVESVMNRCPVSIEAETPVAELAGRFREARYSQMAIVDRRHLVGIVHRRDVMRLIRSSEQVGLCLGGGEESTPVDAANAMRGPRYIQNRKLMAERSLSMALSTG